MWMCGNVCVYVDVCRWWQESSIQRLTGIVVAVGCSGLHHIFLNVSKQ